MNIRGPDLDRWPLLGGAALCVGAGATLLASLDQPQDVVLAALVLIVLGAVLLGAFIVRTVSGGAGDGGDQAP